MNPAIFKSYDIRGLSPQEVNAEVARRLGEVLTSIYKPRRVLIGRDMRTTSPELEASLVEAFLSAGVDVTRIGLCSTPLFYFAVGEGEGRYDLGVMVTASHNPAEYNGFKLVRGDCRPIGQGSGMEEIRDRAVSGISARGGFASGEEYRVSSIGRGGEVEDVGVKGRYIEYVFRLAKLPESLPRWSVALDAGNGMNGFILPDLVQGLPSVTVHPLYWELDGSFPHHEANPLKLETLHDLQQVVKDRACALGVAFDGDGDRVGFVDEEGTPIPGDILTALLARELLRDHQGGRVLYDLRSSWVVAETIRAAGGEAGMCRVGHAHIKQQMREEGALFAGELSMHFYFADFWYAESSDYALLLLLKILACENKPLSQIWRPLQKYAHSGEINFTVQDPRAVLQTLEQNYAPGASGRSTLDGLRLEFCDPQAPEDDWWFNVRASNTEPVLRLNLETRTLDLTARRVEELRAILQGNAASGTTSPC